MILCLVKTTEAQLATAQTVLPAIQTHLANLLLAIILMELLAILARLVIHRSATVLMAFQVTIPL